MGGIDSLAELRECSAEKLKEYAAEIVETRALAGALDTMDASPNPGAQWRQVMMWCQDALHFIVLDQSVKDGDVRMLEKILLSLLFRFIGGGNGKYAVVVLELMQGLYRKWPEELA